MSVLPVLIPVLTRRSDRPDRRLAASMDQALLALHAMERLEVISSEILDGVQEGESYEVLVRRLVCLDNNLRSLRDIARKARISPVLPANDKSTQSIQAGTRNDSNECAG